MGRHAVLVLLFLLCFLTPVLPDSLPKVSGWYHPSMPRFSGYWEASVGLHFWSDHAYLRNLQVRHSMYVSPGVRLNSIVRSNSDLASLSKVSPRFDELFLEHLGYFYDDEDSQFSYSLKVGRTRYLRFPYPDMISRFDQVQGIEDLTSDIPAHYQGLILSAEYDHYSGFGLHMTGIQWIDARLTGLDFIESYGFYRQEIGMWDLEFRLGNVQKRVSPLGRSGWAKSVYLGARLFGWKAGLLYEYIEDEGPRTGVLVQFPISDITKAFGAVHLDYTRAPEGFVFQLPFAGGNFGFVESVDDSAVLIGELHTERMITYWQNGQGRNFYEHIVSVSGDTNSTDLEVVMDEGPWILGLESLVSRHNQFKSWDDLVDWERKRQGPAQLSQKVVYRYYRVIKESSLSN